jgi:hypothetical protein
MQVTMAPVLDLPLLKGTVIGFLQWPPGFNPKSGHVTYVVDNVAVGQGHFNSANCFAFIKHHITNITVKQQNKKEHVTLL